MTAVIKAGSEVDTLCNKCELNLAHTVIAVVGPKIIRVRCNTCQTEHAYRDPAGAKARAASRARKAAAPAKVVISFAERLEAKPGTQPKSYSVKQTFAVDEVINHPTFGLGIVNAVRGDKIDVAFKAFEKTLVHGKGSPEAPKPVVEPASAPTTSEPTVQ
ncbi:MAG: hypothetical protein K1X64_17225 [Myxococcaceae bacterium]|nr:hypothetical protein [Myxococcaceae bacterium]